jgi:uncharacterized protein (DUF1684 family)
MKKLISILFFLTFSISFGQNNFVKDSVIAFQKQINLEYADARESPLLEKDLKKFKTLDFYPINETFFILAKFVRTPDEKPFEMTTTTTRKPIYVKYGEAHFLIDGKSFTLNIFQSQDLKKIDKYKNSLFLPFTDLTSGVESYGGGRYVDLEIPDGDLIPIDFNTAYNPYCAYNHKYSCPIPPQENDLAIEIKAGVKKFKK